MKALLADLARVAATSLDRPADPKAVMFHLSEAMSTRTGRPIRLVFRAFPDSLSVSGVRLNCGEHSIIAVEERMPPESQLVILGHELYHEAQGDCGHDIGGLTAAARTLTYDDLPWEEVLAVASRADSHDEHEVDAETFGLLFGHRFRSWMLGRYARGPISRATLEGRIASSLTNRSGRII